jgi:hypothetical protein
MLTGWGASKARAGYTGGQWQDATCYVRESLKGAKEQSLLQGYFNKFQNSCVDKDQRDVIERPHSDGNQSLEMCLQACQGAEACTAVEWYNNERDGARCYFISLGEYYATPAAGGSAAGQFMDALCYVKKQPEDLACSTYTKF